MRGNGARRSRPTHRKEREVSADGSKKSSSRKRGRRRRACGNDKTSRQQICVREAT